MNQPLINKPLENIERLLLVMIQGKQQMAQKEHIKVNDENLSKEYRQGYSDAYRDWLDTFLEVANDIKASEVTRALE